MTIRRMIERKDIKAVRVGSVWRITEEEIERIKKGEQQNVTSLERR